MDEYKQIVGRNAVTPPKPIISRGSHLGEDFLRSEASKQRLIQSRRGSQKSCIPPARGTGHQHNKSADIATQSINVLIKGPPKALVIVHGMSPLSKSLKNILKKHQVVFDLCLKATVGLKQYEDCTKLKNFYKIIFIELNSTAINGYATAKQIRSMERTNKYPKAFICGIGPGPDSRICSFHKNRLARMDMCREYGIDHCFHEPLEESSIIGLINTQFGKRT